MQKMRSLSNREFQYVIFHATKIKVNDRNETSISQNANKSHFHVR